MNREDVVEWVRHLIYKAYGFDYLEFDACEEDNAFEMMWLREDESTHLRVEVIDLGTQNDERFGQPIGERPFSQDRVPQTIAEAQDMLIHAIQLHGEPIDLALAASTPTHPNETGFKVRFPDDRTFGVVVQRFASP